MKLRDAVRAAFAEVREAHPDERFYVFALFSENGDDLQPTCNTHEALARTAKAKGLSEDALRYLAEEFAYHQHGEEHFASLGPRPAKRGFGPAVRALQDLDREGFFGKGKARAEVAVLVLRSDANNREIIELARELNPPTVAARIEAAFDVPKATGAPLLLGRDEAYSIDSLALSADANVIAAAGWFGGSELFVYRLSARPEAVSVKPPRDALRRIALDPTGKTLFGATRNTIVQLALGATGAAARPRAICSGKGDVDAMALTPDGTCLVASIGGALHAWSTATGELRGEAKDARLAPIAFTPDGRSLVGLNEDGALVQLDEETLDVTSATAAPDKNARAMAVSSAHVALGSYDPAKPIRVCSLRTGKLVFDLEQHAKGGITALAVSRDGAHLASAGEDGHVRVWSLDDRRLVLDVRGRQEAMNAVVFIADDRVAAAGRDTSKGPPVYVWELPH